jgi:hypothetical protein
MDDLKSLTPIDTVSQLDKYIIGQDEAKKSVAIALRNRWRRQQVAPPLRDEIAPKNIIMIGPTGVGKTEIARRLANLAQSPFLKVEASKFTEIGYVGRDVESMVRDLVELAVNMAKKEERSEVEQKSWQKRGCLTCSCPQSVLQPPGPTWPSRGVRKHPILTQPKRVNRPVTVSGRCSGRDGLPTRKLKWKSPSPSRCP